MSKPSADAVRARTRLNMVRLELADLRKMVEEYEQAIVRTKPVIQNLETRENDLLYIIHGDKSSKQENPPADPIGSSAEPCGRTTTHSTNLGQTESPLEQTAPREKRKYTRKKKTMVENEPPEKLKWHCADCKKDVEVVSSVVKGVLVTKCKECGGLQVEHLQ
jgi:hypothetical protein